MRTLALLVLLSSSALAGVINDSSGSIRIVIGTGTDGQERQKTRLSTGPNGLVQYGIGLDREGAANLFMEQVKPPCDSNFVINNTVKGNISAVTITPQGVVTFNDIMTQDQFDADGMLTERGHLIPDGVTSDQESRAFWNLLGEKIAANCGGTKK